MRRFDRLEFEDKQQQAQGLTSPMRLEEDRDERHWLQVAMDERRSGLFDNALRYYSRALEVDKSLVAGWVGQVRMLIALEEYPEAELWSRKALEMFKNNAELLAARAQALCRIGDLKSAQASCDAAIGQQGLYSYPWLARGELMVARRESMDEYCFDKAAQLDPDWLVPLEVGSVYQHYGRTAKALTWVRKAVEKGPDQAYCWYRQGVCELGLGLTGAAEKSFDRCLQLAPKHALAREELWKLSQNRKPVKNFLKRFFRFS